jgi:hypothetical protein
MKTKGNGRPDFWLRAADGQAEGRIAIVDYDPLQTSVRETFIDIEFAD